MNVIENSEYPRPRQWNIRVSSAPNIPRGTNGMVEALRRVLQGVKDGISKDLPANIEGSNSSVSIDDCCTRLRPAGFVREANGVWTLTKESVKWLNSNDVDYLAAILCANVKFSGEMLEALKTPKSAQELQIIANESFDLGWKKGSEINRRTVWFRDMGLIEYKEYTQQYSLTDQGSTFIEKITPTSEDEIIAIRAGRNNDFDLVVSDWAIKQCQLSQNELKFRKQSIGYMPGGKSESVVTISEYVLLLANVTPLKTIEEYSTKTYGIKPSSTKSFLTTLRTIGFIEQASRTDFVATELAKKWNENPNAVDFACCLHSHCLFVFEILSELFEKPQDKASLMAKSVVKYGFDKENSTEILNRLTFLLNAGLIREHGAKEYAITKSGEQLLPLITIQENASDEFGSESQEIKKTPDSQSKLLTELRVSSKESSDPDRFERAIAEAFKALGFKAQWLGGSGKTDVLLTSMTAAKTAYKVTVDAKSAANGYVDVAQLNFDTLVDHRNQHQAQYTVVVGCAFQGDRIEERAVKHKIVLLNVDQLCSLITKHSETPVSAKDYKKLFETFGFADLHVLGQARTKLNRNADLLYEIMDCLTTLNDDEETQGSLTAREIALILKMRGNIESPASSEISEMLEFLASPLIGCISKTKDEYQAVGSLKEAAKKFEFYARACLQEKAANPQ